MLTLCLGGVDSNCSDSSTYDSVVVATVNGSGDGVEGTSAASPSTLSTASSNGRQILFYSYSLTVQNYSKVIIF